MKLTKDQIEVIRPDESVWDPGEFVDTKFTAEVLRALCDMALQSIAGKPHKELVERLRQAAQELRNSGVHTHGLNTLADACNEAASALDSAAREPIAFGIVNDQGFWTGIWSQRETAEFVLSKGQPSHNERIVPLYSKADQ